MNAISDWYWGELRSALAGRHLERGWQILAAWPLPDGDASEAKAAKAYWATEWARAEPDRAIDLAETGWLLTYYGDLLVGPRGGDEAGPGAIMRISSDVLVGALPTLEVMARRTGLTLVANLTKNGMGLFLEAPLSSQDGFTVLSGARPRGLVGIIEGPEAQQAVAELFVAFGQCLREVVSPVSPWRLVWDGDLLNRILNEGRDLHLNLRWGPLPPASRHANPSFRRNVRQTS